MSRVRWALVVLGVLATAGASAQTPTCEEQLAAAMQYAAQIRGLRDAYEFQLADLRAKLDAALVEMNRAKATPSAPKGDR